MFQIKWTFPDYILPDWILNYDLVGIFGVYPAFHNFGKLLKLYIMLLGPLHFVDFIFIFKVVTRDASLQQLIPSLAP